MIEVAFFFLLLLVLFFFCLCAIVSDIVKCLLSGWFSSSLSYLGGCGCCYKNNKLVNI
eukprot:m.142246 g.142246  ORF g.142246 m.142246 type:complete len:58 (+) comp47946_c0_seq1:47-220(+)